MLLIEMLEGIEVGTLGVGTVIMLTLIQIAPIKVNPWTWIAGKIGGAINKEVVEKVGSMEREVRDIKKEMGEDRAVSARVRILRFNDELLESKRHSKDSFDQTLDDITNYERYCKNHPEFPNNKTKLAVQNIERVYQKCLIEHDFL